MADDARAPTKPAKPAKKKKSNWAHVFTIAMLAIGLSALAYTVYHVGVHQLWDDLKRIGWWFFAVMGLECIISSLDARGDVQVPVARSHAHPVSPRAARAGVGARGQRRGAVGQRRRGRQGVGARRGRRARRARGRRHRRLQPGRPARRARHGRGGRADHGRRGADGLGPARGAVRLGRLLRGARARPVRARAARHAGQLRAHVPAPALDLRGAVRAVERQARRDRRQDPHRAGPAAPRSLDRDRRRVPVAHRELEHDRGAARTRSVSRSRSATTRRSPSAASRCT